MQPHSPILLLTAVRAAARLHARRAHAAACDPATTLRFVQSMGAEAHAALWGGYSTWPLQLASTIAELEALALQRRMVRARPRAADLVVGDIEGDRAIGVIDEVYDLDARRRLVACSIVLARGTDRQPRVTRLRRLCGAERGDRFIRWYEPEHQEAA